MSNRGIKRGKTKSNKSLPRPISITAVNAPTPRLCKVPYIPIRRPKHPEFHGSLFTWGAYLVANSSLIAKLLYRHTGFTHLNYIPGLDNIEPRWTPTVIPRLPTSHSRPPPKGQEEYRKPTGRTDTRFYSVLDYHHAYTFGTSTPLDVVEALIPLILRDVKHRTDYATAFIESKIDLILEAAMKSTRRYLEGKPWGLLDGVPIAIKDQVDMAGYKTTLGTPRDHAGDDPQTSWCVQKWLDAGAICLGKLNMHEIGLDVSNNNTHYGTPLNPYNETYYTGGSSGGSGLVVGAGICPIALGADGGGSIRIPSAHCGIFGLKPSHDRVSTRPTPNLAPSTSAVGPMAANMVDLEIAYNLMAQPDPLEKASAFFPPPSRSNSPSKILGLCRPWFNRADEPVQNACKAAILYLVKMHGYKVVDVNIPYIHEGQDAHALTILSEIASHFPDVRELTTANQIRVSVGLEAGALEFLQAQKLRNLLMQHLAALWQKHPGMLIVTPTTPNAGWPIARTEDILHGFADTNMTQKSMGYAWLANFTGIPALSAPVGFVDPVYGYGQIPVGLQLMGEWGQEDELIRAGYDLEQYLNEVLEGGRQRPEAWVDVFEMAQNFK